MLFPYATTITAGILLILQMALAGATSGARGKANSWVGDGGNDALLRAMRRHGNLAENTGIFLVGLMLLELSRFNHLVVVVLCAAFVFARLMHALGLSRTNTNNAFRVGGGVLTYLIGFALGVLLIYVGLRAGSVFNTGA